MIGLGSDDDVDRRLAQHDLLTLGLGDAAGDGDGHPRLAACDLALTQFPHLAELGIDLLGRLLADVAGIQDDEIGGFDLVGRGVAQRAQDIGHSFRVIDVHLAAVGLDEQPLGPRDRGGGRLNLRSSQGRGHDALLSVAPKACKITKPARIRTAGRDRRERRCACRSGPRAWTARRPQWPCRRAPACARPVRSRGVRRSRSSAVRSRRRRTR